MSYLKGINQELADRAVKLTIEQYNRLPKTGKPAKDEWTVLASIVELNCEDVCVVALGTGSKCVGRNSLSKQGDVVHDAHAEVIARRNFLCYIMSEMSKWQNDKRSRIFYKIEGGKFLVKNDVSWVFVTTTVPCGDAAIMPMSNDEAVDRKRKVEDEEKHVETKKLRAESVGEDIHRTGAKCLEQSKVQDSKLGGVEYHVTGQVSCFSAY